MKVSCSSVASKLLEKYLDQEATGKERAVVEKHLPDCPGCQSVLRSMQGLRDVMQRPVDEAIQEENFEWTWQKIKTGIQQKEWPSWRESLWSWLDPSLLFRKRVWIPAVAAATILILIAAPLLFKRTSSLPGRSVVEYVESQTYNVMVYEPEKAEVTVIWLFAAEKGVSPS